MASAHPLGDIVRRLTDTLATITLSGRSSVAAKFDQGRGLAVLMLLSRSARWALDQQHMSEPRKHHYLSQFYLRGFSTDGRKIFQFEKKTGRGYECSIHDAGAIRDYHELDHGDFEDPHALEKQLSVAEGRFAAILDEVLVSGVSTRERHACLIELLNLFRVRVPAQKAYFERVLEESVRSVGKMMERHGQLPAPSKQGASIMDQMTISIRNFKCLEMMFRMAADPDILRILATMKASLLDAPEGSRFFTCDQPVALYHPTASEKDSYGVALVDPLIEVSFPLSCQTLLKLTWPPDAPERRAASAAETDEFNRRTTIMGDTYLFSHAPTEAIRGYIARYGRYRAGVEHDTVDKGESIFHVSRNRAVMAADRYE